MSTAFKRAAPAAVTVALALAFGTAVAQPSRGHERERSHLSHADRQFIEMAAGDGMAEVKAAHIAADRASDSGVREFAQRLVQDHTAANQQLEQLASSKGMQLPRELPRKKKHELDELQRLSGHRFDEHFVKEDGVKDHQEDIPKFEKARHDVRDPDLKSWIASTLPKLREHLAIAKRLDRENGAAAMGARGEERQEHRSERR